MIDSTGTVLIFSREAAEWREAEALLAAGCGWRVLYARTAADAAASLADVHIDIAISEDDQESFGVAFLARLKSSHPDIVRVLAVGKTSGLSPKAAKDAAVYQFVRKPIDADQLALVVQRGLEARALVRRHRLLARDLRGSDRASRPGPWPSSLLHGEGLHFEKLIFVSENMAELCDLAREAARTELPVLIQGEAGTGKTLLARALHANSSRRAGPLMIQNCIGESDAALQAALFGGPRLDATAAQYNSAGLFYDAEGGTLFLDEISETSKSFQLSLLRFLKSAETESLLGGNGVAKVRLLAASTRPLRDLAASGGFRQDLYLRLRVFELKLPPLRDRAEDIPLLAECFAARQSAAMDRKILGISAHALKKLMSYDFPGNVGELENEIRRMVAFAKNGEYLTTRSMSAALLAAASRKIVATSSGFSPAGPRLKDKVESLERHSLAEALLRNNWNRSRAAEELGLSRVGLANKIRRYRLDEHN